MLFNHLSLRADTKSTIITTNLSFDRWGEIIKDKILANALSTDGLIKHISSI